MVTSVPGKDHEVKNETRTKLSVVNPENFRGSWAGPGVLATLSGEVFAQQDSHIKLGQNLLMPLQVGVDPSEDEPSNVC